MALYQAAGWWSAGGDHPEIVDGIIRGSHCFLVACQASRIIGMGRAISDGASDAYVQDVTVQDTFRHQGIGRNIVERLLHRLEGDGIQWIGLIAENKSQEFYSPMGFRPMAHATPMVKIVP